METPATPSMAWGRSLRDEVRQHEVAQAVASNSTQPSRVAPQVPMGALDLLQQNTTEPEPLPSPNNSPKENDSHELAVLATPQLKAEDDSIGTPRLLSSSFSMYSPSVTSLVPKENPKDFTRGTPNPSQLLEPYLMSPAPAFMSSTPNAAGMLFQEGAIVSGVGVDTLEIPPSVDVWGTKRKRERDLVDENNATKDSPRSSRVRNSIIGIASGGSYDPEHGSKHQRLDREAMPPPKSYGKVKKDPSFSGAEPGHENEYPYKPIKLPLSPATALAHGLVLWPDVLKKIMDPSLTTMEMQHKLAQQQAVEQQQFLTLAQQQHLQQYGYTQEQYEEALRQQQQYQYQLQAQAQVQAQAAQVQAQAQAQKQAARAAQLAQAADQLEPTTATGTHGVSELITPPVEQQAKGELMLSTYAGGTQQRQTTLFSGYSGGGGQPAAQDGTAGAYGVTITDPYGRTDGGGLTQPPAPSVGTGLGIAGLRAEDSSSEDSEDSDGNEGDEGDEQESVFVQAGD